MVLSLRSRSLQILQPVAGHPSRGQAQDVADYIAHELPLLPPNVRIVHTDDPTSSYVFMDEARLRLVYTSTVGFELAARGVPVLVVADTTVAGASRSTRVRRASTGQRPTECSATPRTVSSARRIRELARRYAVLLFFRFRNILAAVAEDVRSSPRIRACRASDLDPGLDPAMDRVVPGILDGVSTVAPPGSSPEGALSA